MRKIIIISILLVFTNFASFSLVNTDLKKKTGSKIIVQYKYYDKSITGTLLDIRVLGSGVITSITVELENGNIIIFSPDTIGSIQVIKQ